MRRRQFLGATLGAPALAQPAAKPNLLVLVSDQQHWRAVGFQDRFFDTPHLDKLAAGSAVFEHAFCSTPQCSPSRSSLLTGWLPSRTGVFGNIGAAGGNPLRMKTVAAHLQAAGYATAYFGKWHLGGETSANAGWDDEWKQQGDAEVTRRAVAFLLGQPKQKPFALFLNYLEPHNVYDFRPTAARATRTPLPESWHRETFDGKPPVQKQFMTEDQGRLLWGRPQPDWEAYREYYRERVRAYDTEAGRVLDTLAQRGLAANTVVVATSDHGDMDANHRLIFKGPFLYEHMVRIPLIVRMPGMPGRRISGYSAVNTDITPTLLDLAGVAPYACHGRSLKPLLTGGRLDDRPFVIGQYYGKQAWVNPIRMLRTREFKYTRYIKHGEELYDLKNDPHELVNLSTGVRHRKTLADMRAALDNWIKTNDDPFPTQQATTRDGTLLL